MSRHKKSYHYGAAERYMEKMDTFTIKVPKKIGEVIIEEAKSLGMLKNQYVKKIVQQRHQLLNERKKIRAEAEGSGYRKGMAAGYDKGLAEGKEDGYRRGYSKGQEDGLEKGRKEGFVQGNDSGYNKGKDEGYSAGLARGIVQGERIGRKTGFDEGLNKGYKNGFSQGEQAGRAAGYKEAYAEKNALNVLTIASDPKQLKFLYKLISDDIWRMIQDPDDPNGEILRGIVEIQLIKWLKGMKFDPNSFIGEWLLKVIAEYDRVLEEKGMLRSPNAATGTEPESQNFSRVVLSTRKIS